MRESAASGTPEVNISQADRKVLQYGNEPKGKESSYSQYRIYCIPCSGTHTYNVSIWFGKLDNAYSDDSHLPGSDLFGLFLLW